MSIINLDGSKPTDRMIPYLFIGGPRDGEILKVHPNTKSYKTFTRIEPREQVMYEIYTVNFGDHQFAFFTVEGMTPGEVFTRLLANYKPE